MERKSNLRLTQSLRSVASSCDSSAETGLQDKRASVSQLVASGLLQNKEIHPESLMRGKDEWERVRVKTNLSRSKSMGSLQNSAGSIEALRALFESKAATQNKPKSRFRAANTKATDVMPVINGVTEEVRRSTEESHISADAKDDGEEGRASREVVNQSLVERRRTVGAVDFDEIVASQVDEKRRSIADFRGSSVIQKKEKLCVSVKAISALYLSKAAPQEPKSRLLKPAQDQSSESGKRVIKMAEDAQQKKDDHLPVASVSHQLGSGNKSGSLPQQFASSPPPKETLYQHRQKCELRRLLKHTQPELKMLDEAVDEEFAEILSSETEATTAEADFEGEVLSRRLIFENCSLSNPVSPYTPKIHTAGKTVERSAVSKTSAVFEQPEPLVSSSSSPDSNRECEEEVTRIDVQATRRIFESKSVNISRPNLDDKGKVSISGGETGTVQKQMQELEMCHKGNLHSKDGSSDLTDQPRNQGSCVVGVDRGFCDRDEASTIFEDEPTNPDRLGEIVNTSAALFQNNPFIAKNIEREQANTHTTKADIQAEDGGDCLPANVKNRAHLFESMPFDKIRHQNQDEIETMVEKIKESLNSLHHFKAIHSDGSIIEVTETMIARKAKFTLTESGPQIKYDEVAEGSSQNFILHLLPRGNLKPQITYLKEDSKGNIETSVVNVPVQQHQFPTAHDTECKTANVAQLIEDILNQDNSVRKGVIIQEGVDKFTDVIVYSLYKYADEEDVRRYNPQQRCSEHDEPEADRSYNTEMKNERLTIGAPINSPLGTSPDQISKESIKVNVKLFRNCIEKGDLEYLKTLQAEPTVQEQELPVEQGPDLTEEGTSEWVPVDVKKLKSMFSGDGVPAQPKQYFYTNISKNLVQSTTPQGQNTSPVSGWSSTESYGVTSCGQVSDSSAISHLKTHDADGVHQAELVEVLDGKDEILNLQTAIHSLRQATMEAKSIYCSSQEKQSFLVQESFEPSSINTPGVNLIKQTELSHDRIIPTSEHEAEYQCGTACLKDEEIHGSEKGQTCTEAVQKQLSETAMVPSNSSETAAQQQDEEVVLEGRLKAALDSLERSNLNVTRGDFKAAMIYRNSSKSLKEATQPKGEEFVERQTKKPNSVGQESPGGNQQFSGTSQKCVEIHENCNIQGSVISMESDKTDSVNRQDEVKDTAQDKSPQNIPVKDNTNDTDESHVDFNEARKIFEGAKKSSGKSAPAKPKRAKIAQSDNKKPSSKDNKPEIPVQQTTPDRSYSKPSGQTADRKETHELRQEVQMREKKGRAETEDERRQRLSVHMDEIMRGNTSAAMEIFDNLRKQEELKSILSRVEEIEEDTSEVDVKSLRRVFEDVPHWVVNPDKGKQTKVKPEHKEERLLRDNNETKSSMAHVFGDLERASEEIMNLKEQTLARLVDIEEAIKKALYSVSTLKSESDIAGLSCLFKESLGTVQESPSSGNISKISIGSSRAKSAPTQEGPTTEVLPRVQGASNEITSATHRASPLSSPAFISIQSAARKADKTELPPPETCPTCQHSPKTEEIFRTTKTITCNSPAQDRKRHPMKGGQRQSSPLNPKGEMSVFEVQTDCGGTNILGTKTVTENYERTDTCGNRIYSSKTSTTVTTQPETTTSSTGQVVVSPTTYQITTYPEVRLPINQKP
ncbi:xin actin-binding repeat-containing protein 1 [Aulostomus maculatus]